MRNRMMDANYDMVFGHGPLDFFVDNNQAVAQAIRTTLLLFQGEWFLDTTVGVPWLTEVVGINTAATYDVVIKSAILGVPGVSEIATYSSSLNNNLLTVNVTVTTTYGTTVTVNGITITT